MLKVAKTRTEDGQK